MPRFAFEQVDAFTDRPLTGNACAVVFDADPLDEGTMQAIAREMNLSETAFVLRSERADVRARYFTPASEIPMAGHPTLATIYALVESGRLLPRGETTRFRLELPVGVIPVDVEVRGGRTEQVVMGQQAGRFLERYPPEVVAGCLGLDPEQLMPGQAVQTVSTGTPQLMVPARDLEAVQTARWQPARMLEALPKRDFFSVHLFCTGGVTPEGDTFARHFTLPPDLFEDPFTGSATGGMGAYLWHYGLIDAPEFRAEQGHGMGRPGRGQVEVIGPPDDIAGVRVGGAAVTVLRGELEL